MKHPSNPTFSGRRQFCTSVARLAGTSLVLALPGVRAAGHAASPRATYTVKQVIDLILKEVPGAPLPNTVDQLRSGRMEQEITGIVTTTFPTLEVIEKTAKAGANFIVAHETPFYNNADETDWLQSDDAYRYKVDLLNKHQIAVWRFHDAWHAHKPDGIIMGTLTKLGWADHFDPENPRLLTLPKPVSIKSVVKLTKDRLDIRTVRLVGDPARTCRTIYLAFGYMDSKRQIAAIGQYKPDLILSGETREWETVERVRDGLRMGQPTALLVLSHAVSEEAGMEYAAGWLQPKVPGLRVTHIAANNPFTFL
jgi:putative NIF3 family GTP cyclohydrolase 1 type 2